MLDDNILMLVRPSCGEHTFYKVKDANSIALTASVGNEPEGETAKFYVLKKIEIKVKAYWRCCSLGFLEIISISRVEKGVSPPPHSLISIFMTLAKIVIYGYFD